MAASDHSEKPATFAIGAIAAVAVADDCNWLDNGRLASMAGAAGLHLRVSAQNHNPDHNRYRHLLRDVLAISIEDLVYYLWKIINRM